MKLTRFLSSWIQTRVASALLVALFAAPLSSAQDGKLPITRVVLYKHGLGYFERQGDVTGEARVSLRFKQGEMSDVLKSLTVLDRSGGAIEAIAYDSQKPPEMQLAEFAFDLRTDEIQSKLLEQLRGARVTVDFAGRGSVTGSVLGIDSRSERVGTQDVKRLRLSLLGDDGKILAGDLDDLRSLRFDDKQLADDIGRYLGILRSTHRRDQRTLDLVCRGEGARAIFASYTVEQPVWKASYRLVLEDAKKPFLQGWAVIDNTSDEDWTNVRLSLVAGLPVSFRQDLYTPEFRTRPLLEIDEVAVADAEMLRRGVDKLAENGYLGGPEAGKKQRRLTPGSPVTGGGGSGGPGGAWKDRAPDADMKNAFRDVEAQSLTREIGDLLEYEIDHEVTIPRNRSALLPIVSGELDGDKVSVYNERARPTNPLSAIRVKNTTGLSLEGGPLTVLDGDTYAGEAYLESLKPNETRYVPFAVDLGVKATTKLDSKNERIHKVAFVNGSLITTRRNTWQKTYTFDNRNAVAKKVVIEHARRGGLELRSPQPIDTDLVRYRFEVEVPSKETKAVTVMEVEPVEQAFIVGNLTENDIAYFSNEGALNADSERFLKEMIAAKAAIAEIDRQIGAREQELSAIRDDEARLRKNREVLGDSPEEKELVKLYVDQLRVNETRVQSLTKQQTEARTTRQNQQAALDQKIREFALTYTLG